MRQTLYLATMFAAALLGSEVANAAGTLYAKDYESQAIVLGSAKNYDKLVVDVPLTMTGGSGFLDLYDGATFAFAKKNGADAICGIFTAVARTGGTVFFNNDGDVYNITFDADAQRVVAAAAGTPITLIEDLNKDGWGFNFCYGGSPSMTTLTLNGAKAGETVEMGGTQFTYVGPKESDYVFQSGEIGFTGYEEHSHALNLVVGGGSVPEPATGTLSLLALAGLCARRRK